MEAQNTITDLVVDVVTAYVRKNSLPAAELPALIGSIHRTLSGLTSAAPVEEVQKAPAVSVKKSIGTDYLICLEDGLKFKSLKRHLRTKYSMTPEDYRAKWNLPKDYPMVAPSYAAARSALAKQMGLGVGGRGQAKPRKKAAVKA